MSILNVPLNIVGPSGGWAHAVSVTSGVDPVARAGELPCVRFPRAELHDFKIETAPLDLDADVVVSQRPLGLRDFDLCGMARRARHYEATCAVVEAQKRLAEKALRRGGSSYGSNYLKALTAVSTDVRVFNVGNGPAAVARMTRFYPTTTVGMPAMFAFSFPRRSCEVPSHNVHAADD